MAWNPSPEVAAARDFGKKFNAKRVVILYEVETGQVGMVTYGKDRKLCDGTRRLADAAMLYERFGEAVQGAR